MKRKSLLFLLLFALIAPWAANAQTLTVCDGTTTNSYVPIYGYWADNAQHNQMIYPATDLSVMNGMSITSMTFYLSTGATGNDIGSWTVSLGETTQTTLTGLDGTTSLTQVYSGAMTFDATAMTMSFEFDNGYVYHGGNLLVDFTHTAAGYRTMSFLGIEATSAAVYQYGSSSASVQNFLPKNTFSYGTPASTPKPTGLAVSNVTDNSATLSWTENGTATSWQLCINGDEDNPTTINTNPYTLTNLTATTAYTVKLRSVGNGEYSAWSNEVSFSTTAVAVAVGDAWSDDFEGTSCGWELINGDITNAWAWGTATNNGGTHALYVSNDGGTTNAYTNNSAAMVYATKLLNFADGKYEFSYDWNGNGESTWDYMRVALVPASVTLTASTSYPTGFGTTSLPTGWIALDGGGKLNLATAWQSMNATVNVTAGNYYLVMAWRDDTSGGTNPPAAVDNVSITKVTCDQDVTNLAVSEITTNSAILSWNGGEATQWQVAYGTASNFEGATEEIVSTASYNMSGLQSSSTYFVKVRAYCGGEDFGSWSDVLSFPTACDIITTYPYTENFDSYTAGAGVLPTCWSRINKTTYTSFIGNPRIYNGSANSASNSLYFYSYAYYSSDGTTTYDPQDQYAILPEMQGLNGLRIKLYARAYSTSSDYYDATFHVGIMTDPMDETTFTEVATYKPTSTTYQLYTIPFDTYTGNGTYIAIKVDAAAQYETSQYSYHALYIDDITVDEIPSCLEPTNLDVTANGQAATLTWVSEVGAYEIAHALEAAADPDENIAGTATEATYTMNDLALGDHYFWVRSNCGDDYSSWAGPVNVHIGYCVPAPTSVDNNGISNVTFGIGDDIVNNTTTMGTGVATYLDYTSLTGALQAGVESTVAITYKTSYTYGTIIWVDFDNSLSFEESEIVYMGTSTSANPTTLNATFVIPATVTPGNYVMRIGGADSNFDGYIGGTSTTAPNPCYTGTYACFQDYTLSVLEAPSCMPISGLTSSNVTAHTVDLTWTAGGDETAWVVAYKAADEEEFTEVPATTNSFTLSELRSETIYTVKVAANCGGSQSIYSQEITFTTTVACPAPTALNVTNLAPTSATLNWTGDATTYNVRYKVSSTGDADPIFSDDFENGLDLTSWTIVDADGDGYNWYEHINSGTGNHTTHSGDGVVSSESYNNDASLALTPDNWLITPQVQLGGSVSFWAIGQDASYAEEHFAVFVSTTGTTPADFTQVSQEFVATGEYVNYVADLSSYSGMGYVAIRHFNVTDMFVLNIDDFAVYGPSSTVEEWITINNVSGNSTDLTGLNPETDYIWQVQAVCGGEDGVSAWASSNFTTLSACAAPNNLSAEATATGATLNWTGYQDSYNVQYRTAGFDGYYVNETWDGDEIGDWSVSNLQSGGGIFSEAGVDGSKCFGFYYTTNPPQYLISPDLREGVGGKTLTFSYKAYSANYAESFKVGFANGEETSFDEMTWEAEVTTEDTEWHEYQTTVPEGTLYFVIQCTSYDAFYLFVDNFVIYDETEIVEAGAWVDATANENTLAITGLTPETEYEWQVQGVCENGETEWVNAYFTTLEQTTQTLTVNLVSGTNWFSTNVEITLEDLQNALLAALNNASGIKITSQTSGTSMWTGRAWRGTIDPFDVSQHFVVLVPADCEIVLEGSPINPASHTLSIVPGNNWIGFPLSQAMTVTNAFAGFPVRNDRVSSQASGFTTFNGSTWRGNLANLEPGKGYIYNSASSENRTHTFPTGSAKAAQTSVKPSGSSLSAAKKQIAKTLSRDAKRINGLPVISKRIRK